MLFHSIVAEMFLLSRTNVMSRLVIILLTCLQISAFSTTVLIEQFRQAIKTQGEFFITCPGTVIVVDDVFEKHYQDVINDFVQMYTLPIIIINIDNVNISSLFKSHNQLPEFMCNHLVQWGIPLKIFYCRN